MVFLREVMRPKIKTHDGYAFRSLPLQIISIALTLLKKKETIHPICIRNFSHSPMPLPHCLRPNSILSPNKMRNAFELLPLRGAFHCFQTNILKRSPRSTRKLQLQNGIETGSLICFLLLVDFASFFFFFLDFPWNHFAAVMTVFE